jgi:periplasmic divalent cation tolerance protein
MTEQRGSGSHTQQPAPRSGPAASSEHIVVLVSCGGAEQASAIARATVEARVAACAQMLPIRSCYRWQGEVVEEAEVLVLLKTRADRFDEVERVVRSVHDYEIPEIVALPLTAGTADYLAWVDAEL